MPSPGWQASLEEILGVDHVGDRKLLEIEASKSKRGADSGVYDAGGGHFIQPGWPAIVQCYREIVVEIFKN